LTDKAARLRADAETLSGPWPPLLLAARRLAASLALGLHGRRRPGSGESFWQYRHYQWGDPSRTIDWRQSARSDDIYVRETEWSVAASLWFWIDNGPSMTWRSTDDLPTKYDRAALLALAVSLLAAEAGEQVALAGIDRPPSNHESGLVRIAKALSLAGDGPEPKIEQIPEAAELVLFSDFEAPLEDVAARLKPFGDRRVTATLVRISDPAEEQLPFRGHVLFSDPASPTTVRIPDSGAMRPAYRKQRDGHKQGLRALAESHGWRLLEHTTDHPASAALLALHAGLSAGNG